MKRRVRVILGVGPVPGTRGQREPLWWRTMFRHDIISWNKKEHTTLLIHGEDLLLDCYWLKYWSDNHLYLGAEEFIITQIYIHEKKV